MPGNGKTVRLIPYFLDQMQRRMFCRQLYRFATIGENQRFEARFAPFALGNTEHWQV